MNNFQFMGTFDPLPVLHQLRLHADLWKADTYLRDYPQGPFEDTQTVFIRFPKASVSELERSHADQHECVWMDGAIHIPAYRPLIFWLMNRVEGERLGRVMINKLRCGGRVFPHADSPEHAQYWERYHFVLQSSVGCNFRCGDETIYMQPGNIIWFDHRLEHEVVNNSSTERIHMIADIRVSKMEYKGLRTTELTP